MKKNRFLKEQTKNKIFENSGINIISNSDLMVVDIQPEYQGAFGFNLQSFFEFINQNYKNLNSLTFLYNGYDTLGMVSENEFKEWEFDYGLDEDIIYNNATYYDKGYAFFRYCIDSDIEDEDIADLVKFMIKYNINDSRDMDENNNWSLFMKEYNHDQSEIKDLLEYSSDMINIPDLMDFIRRYGKIVLCGGGINECLKEVEIALMALDKKYDVLTKYTY